jgi:hypothetical protein
LPVLNDEALKLFLLLAHALGGLLVIDTAHTLGDEVFDLLQIVVVGTLTLKVLGTTHKHTQHLLAHPKLFFQCAIHCGEVVASQQHLSATCSLTQRTWKRVLGAESLSHALSAHLVSAAGQQKHHVRIRNAFCAAAREGERRQDTYEQRWKRTHCFHSTSHETQT